MQIVKGAMRHDVSASCPVPAFTGEIEWRSVRSQVRSHRNDTYSMERERVLRTLTLTSQRRAAPGGAARLPAVECMPWCSSAGHWRTPRGGANALVPSAPPDDRSLMGRESRVFASKVAFSATSGLLGTGPRRSDERPRTRARQALGFAGTGGRPGRHHGDGVCLDAGLGFGACALEAPKAFKCRDGRNGGGDRRHGQPRRRGAWRGGTSSRNSRWPTARAICLACSA